MRGDLTIDKIALVYEDVKEGKVLVEKGMIIFVTGDGLKFMMKANCLGDGFKRLVEFMKELKKMVRDEESMGLAGYIEELLIKYKINIEGL